MDWQRENRRYLPGFKIPQNVAISPEFRFVLSGAEIVLVVVPSRHFRSVLKAMTPCVPQNAKLVSATKGLENPGLGRMSEVMAEVLPGYTVAVLSGPTFAREIAAGEPAAVVIASERLAEAESIQQVLSTPALRFYASTDVAGTELGAALKNVIAIGAGVCRGLGFGSNSVAALVTRGLAEITRLALALGGCARTLSGLAGLGDLVLTATGDLSRNRQVGIQLGQGRPLEQIQAEMTMVAEGVETCRAAYELGRKTGVDLPIINKMYEVLYGQKYPREAIRELMERRLTTE